MIKVNCNTCGKNLRRSPSKVNARNYCSYECFSSVRNAEISARGINTRMTTERSAKYATKRAEALRIKNVGPLHPMWRGDKASYRAVHYWVTRQKGKPSTCSKCGVSDERPRYIQWANVDGKYRRSLEDFIAMCVSCHKNHDLAIARLGGR